MNRRTFIAVTTGASIALPITAKTNEHVVAKYNGRQLYRSPDMTFTPYDLTVLTTLRNNMQRFQDGPYGVQVCCASDTSPFGDIIHVNYCNPSAQILMDHFEAFYRKSFIRHVLGVQPMCGPTGLIFCNRPDLSKDELFRTDTHRRAETRQDYIAMHGYEAANGVDFTHLDKVTVTGCSRTADTPEQLLSDMEREILRIMVYLSKPVAGHGTFKRTDHVSFWDTFVPQFVLVHPSKTDCLPTTVQHLTLFENESMSEDVALYGSKISEHDAPLFYGPYLPMMTYDIVTGDPADAQNTKWKSRYGLCANPYYSNSTGAIIAGNSHLLSTVKI